MIRLLKVSISAAIALAIWSCALPNEKSDYRLGDNVGKGLVVFSLSVEGSERVYIAFRQAGHVEHDVVYVNARGVKGLTTNYDWEEPFGRLIYLELEEGEYEFYGWHPQYVCGWDLQCFSLSEKIRFSVNPDTVSYIGNIHFEILLRDQAYKHEIRDEFDRDVSLLTARLGNVTKDQVLRKIPNTKN